MTGKGLRMWRKKGLHRSGSGFKGCGFRSRLGFLVEDMGLRFIG